MKPVKSRADLRKGTLVRVVAFGLVLVCGSLVVHEVYGGYGLLEWRRQRRQYQALEEEVRQLQRENQELEKQIKALRSDPRAIEKRAREELHLARPGEIVYTLPDRNSPKKNPTPDAP